MLPWLIGAAAVGLTAVLSSSDDDYDDDDYEESAERRRRREKESKKQRLSADIESYKKQTVKRFRKKYKMDITFSDEYVSDIEPLKKVVEQRESLEKEAEELALLIEALRDRQTSKLGKR